MLLLQMILVMMLTHKFVDINAIPDGWQGLDAGPKSKKILM